jgi:hypothetical protein
MILRTVRVSTWLSLCAMVCLNALVLFSARAQDIRWLRVGDLQSFVSEMGMEDEGMGTGGNTNYSSWPALYSIDQNFCRMRLLWIGCKNFNDPVENKVKTIKIVGTGLSAFDDRPNQVFPQEFKLIGKTARPSVTVDNSSASVLDQYDLVDQVDPSLPCDRMVVIRFNTSIGISVTKKVMVFANSRHGNYFINDYVFKNTGIINKAGTVKSQTLDSLWFYFAFRYAFAGVSSSGWGSTWGAFASCWGHTTQFHNFGENPLNPEYTYAGAPMRGFFGFYTPSPSSNNSTLSYAQDWGCPDVTGGTGMLGSAKYAGCVTLHADVSASDKSDNTAQPKTTWYISADISPMRSVGQSQYDDIALADRWGIITEGHPTKQMDEAVGDGNYASSYGDARRNDAAQGQGFGPYSLAPGDSIHIVYAEGASGISWEKGREVGDNWLKWFNSTSQPALTMPDGSTTTDFNLYKRRWVETGRDSLLATYQHAIDNYRASYTVPEPPPPPSEFTVTSGGDRIALTWASNAESNAKFGGYVIYRSKGTVLDYRTVYEKIFECNAGNAVHQFDDVTAVRGFYYYYYIVSKDNGTQVPGTTLYSSPFYTITSAPATLQRPAVTTTLDSVRVVPNPYDIRGRFLQFGDRSQYDQISVYGLPPIAKLKVFTERGDLIWEKAHTSGTGDVLWTSQSSAGQIVASGVYILVVEAPDGRSVIRKFVVIR